MKRCRFCGFEFEGLVHQEKAFHAKWCKLNPGLKPYLESLKRRPGWNKGLTKETDSRIAASAEKLSKRNKGMPGKKHSKETKEKLSQLMKGNRHANHRGDRQSFYKDVRMDSKWEVGVARFLDENNISWKYCEKSYILSDGRHYTPDFFIYEEEKLIHHVEVKGYFREENKRKFQMFQNEYPNISIEIWAEKELRERKIISCDGYLLKGV